MTDKERVFFHDTPQAEDRFLFMWDMDTPSSSLHLMANSDNMSCTCLHNGDNCHGSARESRPDRLEGP
jgi:hypothetical protein